MSKVYTLTLTAEELEDRRWESLRGSSLSRVAIQVAEQAEQARADRERDDMRLPWSAEESVPGIGSWCVQMTGHRAYFGSDRAAKLASAAPELLEAVQAVKQAFDMLGQCERFPMAARLIERALRKVETGVPEGDRG
jgi:hypothetical protein